MMRKLILLATAALILAAISPAFLNRSSAATTTKLRWITQGNNKFRNFDFTSTKGGSHRVDWPVDFIYMNNASISAIQSDFNAFFPCTSQGSPYQGKCAARMYMHYSTNGGSTYKWMQSATLKQSLALCAPAQLHQRIYAPNGRWYSTSWGYYVIGTTHFDYHEGCHGWSGKSEKAEKTICQDWVIWVGDYCYYDQGNGGQGFGNAMPNHVINGNPAHWWMNDGKPTMALVP